MLLPVLRGATALCAAAVAVLILLGGCAARTQAAIREFPIAEPTPPPLDPSPSPSVEPSPAPTTTAPPTTAARPTTTRPTTASSQPPQWTYVPSAGPVAGTNSGPLWHYRVAVETGVPVSIGELAGVVTSTLSDPRSWIAGPIRLQQVGPGDGTQFTIWLTTPGTAYTMCLASGIDIRIDGVPYTSCRAGNNVVLNADRYLKGVPNYGAPLSAYRQYMVNHEVGHWLGNGHELCPGPGQLAPVMQQQTLGLQGCVANSWPYINGVRYSGPRVT